MAWLFSAGADGSCGEGREPVYRFEGTSPTGAKVFDVGLADQGGGLKRSELLGCVKPA